MIEYILRKLFQSFFVIFSVITVVYLLQNNSVSDPVDDFINSSFGEKTATKEAYMAAYIKEAKRQNKDQPSFYFSIVPSYFPDTLHKVIFHQDRVFIKDLLRYSKNTEGALNFWSQIQSIEYFVESDSTLSTDSRTILNRIARERDVSRLSTQIKQLELLKSENPAVENLINRYYELSNSKKTFTFPKFIWHGSKNQYHSYITAVFTGQLGKSKSDGKSASTKILNSLKWSLSMNTIVFAIAALLGLWIGLWSIKNDGKRSEKSVATSLLFVYTMPVFWTATIFLVFFTTKRYGGWMDIFPSPGLKFWYTDEPFHKQLYLSASQLLLPIICMTIPTLAYMSRIMKSKFAEVVSENFITTLKAKGLDKKRIFNRHVLKNGLIPYITILTGSIPGLFTGSLVIEKIFNIPGIGNLLLDSIYSSDWPVISGLVIMLAVVTVIAYLLADILYSKVNPRIVLGK